MSMIRHHASIETLAAYAAGHLDEARTVVVSTHLERCEQCRETVRDLEALGGICLDEITPVAMADDAMKNFWKIAEFTQPDTLEASTRAINDSGFESVKPLSDYLKGGLDNVQWRTIVPGVYQYVLNAQGYRDGALRLLKINPGTLIPEHSHGDNELTLILRGAYRDNIGTFEAGDLSDLDDTHHHSPEAIGDEPCICLIATSAPLAFKSVVGKVIQPFIGL